MFIPVAREEMISKLAAGYADIAGTLIVPRDSQTAEVDYTSPLIQDAPGVVVTGPTAPLVAKLEDLSGYEVYAHEHTAIWDRVKELNDS